MSLKRTEQRYLVTGGAGFLGSHLCRRLLADGGQVLCLDNFFTGSKKNIIELTQNPKFELIRHDITEPIRLEVDNIFNLACPASPISYHYDPIYTTKTSDFGAYNVLGLAKRLNARVMQASTSEIYGDPLINPQPESYWGNVNTIGPRSCYDEGKRCAETLFSDYYLKFGVSARVARLFNTYGPNMDINDGRVVSNFIVQALTNKPITIFGDGRQTRSFCYVDDLIEGFVRLMNVDIPLKECGSLQPINLGNPVEFTMVDLAQQVLDLTGSKSKIEFHPLPQDDPMQRRPDISKAESMLNGWSPKVHLREGLLKTIEYFDSELGG